MADRTDQVTTERDSFSDTLADDFDLEDDSQTQSTQSREGSGGWLSSRTPSLGSYFSPKGFLARVVVLFLGTLAMGFVPLVGGAVATALGMFAAAFLMGVVSGEAKYFETALAGGALGALLFMLSSLNIALIGGSAGATRLVAVGTGFGLVAALLGLYFGRDLRKGLTADIGD